ncbi:MAG TPA: hypothetical protein VN636_05590 [Acidimicrobiia bacterium]|nr:hypothetical protein [Acidimicrobiia bacterium]
MNARLAAHATSTKNIVGCACAAAGPILALTGFVTPLIGLALVPVLYVAGARLTPARRPAALVGGHRPRDVHRSLDDIRRECYGRVPPDVAVKVNRIATTINATLPRAHALGAGSPAQFVLVRCATDYLPSTLHAYLDLPRAYADHHVVSDGKTARQLLSEQLDVLVRQVSELSDAVNRADTDKLLVNGRFLAAKFGDEELDVEEPPRLGPLGMETPPLPPTGSAPGDVPPA